MSETLKLIADFFLLSLGGSLVAFSPVAASNMTGVGFIKLIVNLAIGCLVLSLLVYGIEPLRILTFFLLVIMSYFHRDDKTLIMWILTGLIGGLFFYFLGRHVHFSIKQFLFLLSSALLLGAISYSMVLGHWYLVVPKLSEKPLKILSLIVWFLLFLKILWSSYSVYQNLDFFESGTEFGGGYAFNWMLLLMRTAFGYLVILAMSIFNWKLLKLRSIQSSTGVLYAMTFFVFVGELVSTYMFFQYGLYI